MKKSKFNLTHLHSTTLDPGYLVPFLCMPTLPNDTFRIGLSTFIRAQPMLAPLMHEVRLFTQYWFVPNRILWDEWEDFITGGEDLSLSPPLPYVTSTAADATAGSLWDYLGFPLVEGLEVSALPFRALAEIWNTRYRDQDLQDELVIDYGSNEDTTTSRKLLSPAFSKDYFTTARPFTQRGGDVAVPVIQGLGGSGINRGLRVKYKLLACYPTAVEPAGLVEPRISCDPAFSAQNLDVLVRQWISSKTEDQLQKLMLDRLPADGDKAAFTETMMQEHRLEIFYDSMYGQPPGFKVTFDVFVFIESVLPFEQPGVIVETNSMVLAQTCPPGMYKPSSGNSPYYDFPNWSGHQVCAFFPLNKSQNVAPNNSWSAALSNTCEYTYAISAPSTAGVYIRDLRRSAALQRYAERSLKYGNRYEEFIQREFGIKPRDYRIQRPEYLGGGRGLLNISEVLQTAEAADTGVGTMRGHGVASISQRPIRFRCPEHGVLIGLLSIRPKSVYTQGVDREWLKRSRLDFFTPELASIGMQEVLQQELYALPDNKTDVFGYSERYQEYRYQKPLVTGEFRTTLNFWNMARMFANSPNLNAEFISMEHAVDDFKRPFQVQDNSAHAFICMLKNHIRAYRPIPKKAKDILK